MPFITTTRMFTGRINAAGSVLPDVSLAIKLASYVSKTAESYADANPAYLYAAVKAAIVEGITSGSEAHPADSEWVRHTLASMAISNDGVAQAVAELADRDLVEALRTNADKQIAAWQPAFAEAAAVLVEARQVLGGIKLDDAIAANSMGYDASVIWAGARKAEGAISRIAGGWAALGEVARLYTPDLKHYALEMASVSYDAWVAPMQDGDTETTLAEVRRPTPWLLVQRGLDLSLPTYDEYNERVAVVVRGANAVAARFEEERQRRMTGRQDLSSMLR